MSTKVLERDFYGNNVCITTKEDDCTIYRIKDSLGHAVLTRYDVYPGIALVYNDVHTERISICKKPYYQNILEINHCREGRIEFESAEGEYLYVKKGDMSVNMKSSVKEYSIFPQAHYHGVTIELDLDILACNKKSILYDFDLKTTFLKSKVCNPNRCFVMHEKQEFEHLFAELYCVPEQIKNQYYKIKVLEILLFLSAINPEQEKIENRYFNRDLVARVKEIHSYMVNHLEEKLTIDILSEKFDVAQTSLKKCFKEIYGNSIYAYLKEYRIQKASEFLRKKDYEISRIAGMVGYDNASKFASSFKSVMGINPNEYRKNAYCYNRLQI